jgi:hypothetical protein
MAVNPGPLSSSNNVDPLSRVEQLLGATITEAWTLMIIEQLFMDEPTDTTVRNTATFMYGNGVPIQLAS